MRRSLLLAILGVVAAALILADLGTIVLTQRAARDRARQDLVEQADAFAGAGIGAEAQAGTLELVRRVARASGAKLVRLGADGTVIGELPPGLPASSLSSDELAAGETVSGVRGDIAYAATPLRLAGTTRSAKREPTVTSLPEGRNRRRLQQRDAATPPIVSPTAPTASRVGGDVTTVVVLTRQVSRAPIGAGYLLFTAIVALGFAAVVATVVSRRISRHVNKAVETTERIANGDLSATVEVGDGDYPELASLANSINTMAGALSRSRDLERQFLMSVSHDLRTPLTSIRGYAEALSDGVTTDTTAVGDIIQSEARRLERLVADLLELAKLDARSFTLNPVPVDMGAAVVATAQGFLPAAAAAGLRLEISDPPISLQCRVDPDRLAQSVANVVENAMNYAQSCVRVRVEARPASAVIVVEDDGPGIAESDLARVFERLYAAPRELSRQVGSGLGLAIVSELTQAMQGRAQVESPVADGQGTRLILSFPTV